MHVGMHADMHGDKHGHSQPVGPGGAGVSYCFLQMKSVLTGKSSHVARGRYRT